MVAVVAIYITSDAHGHVRALDRALELASPATDDTVYVLGDMIDRGPDPIGVINLALSLPNAHVLMGNHERMMLDACKPDASEYDRLVWEQNGGWMTSKALEKLPESLRFDLFDWVRDLDLYDAVGVGERNYLLAHAGIDCDALRLKLADAGFFGENGYGDVPVSSLRDALAGQSEEWLLWARAEFWGMPTGLVGADGCGPVVIAGHTPTPLLFRYAQNACGRGVDEVPRGIVTEVGPTYDTFGVPDRIDIDCGAASGSPVGRVGVLRLDDRAVFYGDVLDGE
jgi:serine/threonine protein phosphatase 1